MSSPVLRSGLPVALISASGWPRYNEVALLCLLLPALRVLVWKNLRSAESERKWHKHLFVLVLCSIQRATCKGSYLCLVIKRRKFVGFVTVCKFRYPLLYPPVTVTLSFFFFRKIIPNLSNEQLLLGVAKWLIANVFHIGYCADASGSVLICPWSSKDRIKARPERLCQL